MSPPLLFADDPVLQPGVMEAQEHDLLLTILTVYNEPLTEGYPTTRDSVLAGEVISRCFNFSYFAFDSMIHELAEAVPGKNSLAEPIFETCKHTITPFMSRVIEAMGIVTQLVRALPAQLVDGDGSWSEISQPVTQFMQLVDQAKSAWPLAREELVQQHIPNLRRLLFHPYNPIPTLFSPILQVLGLINEFPRINAWLAVDRFSKIINSMDACVSQLDIIQQHLKYIGQTLDKVKYNPKTLSQESLDRVSTALMRYFGCWDQVTTYARHNTELIMELSIRLQTLYEAARSR